MKAPTLLIGRILMILALALSWLAPGASVASAGDESQPLTARVQTPTYRLTANGVAVDGQVPDATPGAPMLPVHGLTFELPPSGEWTLRFESTASRILTERVPVAAVPVPDLDLNSPTAPQDQEEWPTAVPVVDRPDPAIYGVDAFYPASPVIAGEPVLQGGRRILPVRVFPFQFNPVTQELRYHPDLLITVQTERAAEAVLPAGPPPGDFYQPLTLPGDGVLRIHTQDRGLYRLTYADLSAKGVPVGPGGVNPATFAIYYKGQQIAIEVQDSGDGAFDDGDLVIFYAVPYDGGRFQNFNIYQFVWGNGVPSPQRIAPRPVSASAGPAVASIITRTLHVENNRVYRSLYPRADDADHFFDTAMEVKTDTPVVRTYALSLSHPVTDTGNVQIRALIHGGKSQIANPDQSVLLRLNNTEIDTYQWDGRVDRLITATRPASWLGASSNSLDLIAARSQLPGLPLSSSDGTYYWISPDWVQISYPSRAVAASDRLYIEGLAVPTSAVTVTGFSAATIAVYDVSNPASPQRLGGAGQASGAVYWNEAEAGRSYALSSTAALLAPGAIERINRSGRPAAWANPSHAYDYIAIVGAQRNYNGTTTLGDQLAAAVQPLLTYRASSAGGGFNVAVVPVQDIYDEWSYGRLDPLAIRSFLSYAYFNWQTPPGYVLLVGDGHYNFINATLTPAHSTLPMLLPPYLSNVDPWWGEVPADNLFVSVDSMTDYLPDIAVGRLPAINADNVTAVVNKILAYEDAALNPPGLWQQRAVYVADDCDNAAGYFHALSNQARLQELPTAYTNRIVYFDDPNIDTVCPEGNQSTSVGMRLAIRSQFNAGAFFLQWFGHGSQTRWGDSVSMFQANDFPSYGARTQLPLTMANACLTGYFVHPTQVLAEQMVNTASRVSIADLSPSGLHLGSAMLILQEGMHRKLFHERIERAGDVVDAAKWYFFAKAPLSLHDVIDTMIFFGDPALKLRYPTGDLSTSSLEVSAAEAPPGATLGYTLTIRNSSIYTTSLPSAVVDYPESQAIVMSANGAVNNGDTLTWTLPDLPPASQQVVTFTLQVNSARAPDAFSLVVPATVSSQMAPAAAMQATTQIEAPLSVDLEYFVGTAQYPTHILLEWQSVSEQSTQAFRLLRGVTPNPDQAVVITDPPIWGHPGSTSGYYYSYQDSFNLTPGVTYYYWIEDQDLNNIWSQHRDDPDLNPVVPWGCSVYDVVCNFIIDSQDITAIASLWNCALGAGCYDQHFDVNNDGVIDVQDLLLTSSRWGCQQPDACYN